MGVVWLVVIGLVMNNRSLALGSSFSFAYLLEEIIKVLARLIVDASRAE
jgi:hypothetical protein